MKRIVKKIKKIKESRLNSEDKYLLKFLTNLTVDWNGNIISYKQKKVRIFDYDINTYTLYFSFEIYEKYSELLYDRVGSEIQNIDTSNAVLEIIKTNLTSDCIKKKISKEMELLLLEEGKITYNPLFNSITGKCANIKKFYPILV